MKLSNKVISDFPCVCFNSESLTQRRPNELFTTIFLVSTRAWFVPAKSFIPLFLGGPYCEFSIYLCLSSRMKNPYEVLCLSLVRLRECQTRLFAKLALASGILDLFPGHLLSPPVSKITPDHSPDQ